MTTNAQLSVDHTKQEIPTDGADRRSGLSRCFILVVLDKSGKRGESRASREQKQ